MENRRFVIIVTLLVWLGMLPQSVQAYAVPTHNGITEVLIRAYENKNGDILTPAEEQAIIRGSKEEDDSLRFLNHFYDGVTGEGILKYQSSAEWVNNIIEQASWGLGRLPAYTPLFSSKQDYTWGRAVYEYVHGDAERGAEALGHVLHLIQDATVPAHVRGDTHPYQWGVGNKDSYEDFTKDFTSGDVQNNLLRLEPKSFSDIHDAIASTARFTQENFLSKDTLFNTYSLPARNKVRLERTRDDGKNQYLGVGSEGRIVRIFVNRSIETDISNEEYFLTDAKDRILTENWEVLSQHAVASGMGVIDLFFKEVEEERKTGRLLAMNKSYKETDRMMKRLAFGRDSKASLTSLAAADIYELNKDDLDGYYAAAKIYGISTPAAARDSVIKEDAQPASALLGLQQALKKTIVGEPLPDGVTPQTQTGPTLSELQARVNEASALIAFLEALLAQREQEREEECLANSIQGPWNKVGWIGDQPGCEDPTPWIQKMFFAPIQGAGGGGASGISGNISANPSSGFFGPTTISWSTSGATSCTVTGGLSAWVGTSGSEFTLIAEDTTLTLSCDDGTLVESVFVDVDIPQEN